ncbi:hypothetical protein COU56_04915 [Candidatus Pacearchaeota archaeon CG10_big_fil_rev_8_21_14_0_10_31_9]|nr:MAG: hypothetical protein COU56_04915 [Candidatus Pacearchaeota archaeon CG10_big_fil_rev_8_21_14_0_10_31_9]PIZ82472.1 MAG: hypothetical protein COX97_04605 [Candidatus Pacearchaeota archaeon CG_4_10_14_0_2_um_filter_05_32_18]
MVKIPLNLRLKKEGHRKIALAQDILIGEIYRYFNNAVFHGGTAIWRCYNGVRFSEDLDFYLPKDLRKVNLFFENLVKLGFIVERKKISENSIYSTLLFDRTVVRFEAVFKNINGILKEYELIDGNYISVYSLSEEDLIKEKVNAYIKRRKVRDLFDIFFLLRYVEDKKYLKNKLKELIDKYGEPSDKDDLNILILEGIIPKVEDILTYIKNIVDKN